MKVIYANSKIKLKNIVAAIGIFDGIHRGHQYLLKAMLKKAKALNAKSAVITFFPHPAHVLRPDVKLGYLISFEHRLKLLEEMNVDYCVVIPFTKTFAKIDPASFIKNTLVRQLDVKAIFVGEDFRFGRQRLGDVALFQSLADVCGYEIYPMPALKQGRMPVSSTRIRRLVMEGKIAQAQKLLGRPFSMRGPVVKGSGRGNGLGFPTANIDYANDILPPKGVYAVRIAWKNKVLRGVANLGIRPSFKEANPKVYLEVYIFNFNQNVYGQTMDVQFLKKIRSEKKFKTLQALIAQIKRDVIKAKSVS